MGKGEGDVKGKGSLKIVLFVLCLSNQGSIACIFFFSVFGRDTFGSYYLVSDFCSDSEGMKTATP